MKKFLLVILLLAFLVAGGVVTMVGLSFNPAAYEKNVVTTLQKLTGRNVAVGGGTHISWFPMPTVVMRDLRIENIDRAQELTMLSIEKVHVTMAWSSLLKSPFEISKIELTRPVLNLERLESNRANFSLPFLLDPNFQLQEIDLLGGDTRNTVKIDTIGIKEGVVRYLNQITGGNFEVTNIDGKLSVDSVRGPFRFEGKGISGQGQYELSANTGTFQGATPIPLNFQLKEGTTKSSLELSGNLTPVSLDKWYEGSGKFDIGSIKSMANLLGVQDPENKNLLKVGGSLTLEMTPTSDSVKDFIAQFVGEGDVKTAFTGTITRSVQNKNKVYQVNLGSDRLNPEDWAVYWKKADWTLLGQADIPTINFKALIKSIPYQKITVDNVNVVGQYEKGVLTLQKSTLDLPGKGALTFSGKGEVVGDKPVVSVGIQLQTPSLQKTIEPLGFGGNAQWFESLNQKGDIVARLEADPQVARLFLDTVKLGDSQIKGDLQRTAGEHPHYSARVVLNNVNIDSLTGWKAPSQEMSLLDLPVTLKTFFEQAKWASDLNVHGEVDAQDGTIFGLPIGQAHLVGELADNVLKIDTLRLQNIAMANIGLSGSVSGLGRPQINVDALQLSLETKQLSKLLKDAHLAATLPLIQQAGNTSFKLGLKGGRDGLWNIDMQTSLNNASIKFGGDMEVLGDEINLRNARFDVAHPNFQTFAKLLDPSFSSVPKLDGTFKAVGQFSGNWNHFELTEAMIGIGLQQMNGSVTVDNGPVTTVVATVTSPTLDLDRVLPEGFAIYSPMTGFSTKAFDFSSLDKWIVDLKLNTTQMILSDLTLRQAEVQLSLQNRELLIKQLTGNSGTSDKTPVSLSGRLDWNTVPSLTLNFDIKNMPLRSDFMTLPEFAFGGGIASVNGDLKTRGHTPLEMAEELSGQGSLNVLGGQIIGVDVDKMIPILTRAIQRSEEGKAIESDVQRVLHSGKTPIQKISGDYTIANGVARLMDMTLETTNATANPTQIVWNIPKRILDISIPVVLKPLNTLPPFVLGVSATANRATYTPNYKDVLGVLSNQSQEILIKNLKEQEEAAKVTALQKRADREAESQSLTEEARQAITHMEEQLAIFPFERGALILEKAKDMMSLVNQVAVMEEPTDAQLIQQIEQARLVLLQAQEFQNSLEQETVFNSQHQMQAYQDKALQMTNQLRRWRDGYPDIMLLSQLTDNAEGNLAIVESHMQRIVSEKSLNEIQRLMAESEEAVARIQKAYQHAQRFDLSEVSNDTSLGDLPAANTDTQRSVRGSFKRSN